MKEIDFLPEWYKSGQRRQLSYRTQSLALGGIFVVMMVWSFTTTHSISEANAELAEMGVKQAQAATVSSELSLLRGELREFQKKAASLDQIDSKIDVANVLAELSFLVDKRIVLGKVQMIAEKVADEKESSSPAQTGAIVRVVRENPGKKKDLPLGNVRFRIVAAGVAADASDVAALMCKLEDSPYFCQVVLSFSRNTETQNEKTLQPSPEAEAARKEPGGSGSAAESGTNKKIQVTEFEMTCYLANYKER